MRNHFSTHRLILLRGRKQQMLKCRHLAGGHTLHPQLGTTVISPLAAAQIVSPQHALQQATLSGFKQGHLLPRIPSQALIPVTYGHRVVRL